MLNLAVDCDIMLRLLCVFVCHRWTFKSAWKYMFIRLYTSRRARPAYAKTAGGEKCAESVRSVVRPRPIYWS